ncbi:unnamed protein product [Parnassius mnemosyne]|uniref:Uncharacterized protein n=1 Tax=Parnassius mnemosyne TaxID=213953 RepID=A0AAV1KVE0_9NEOP
MAAITDTISSASYALRTLREELTIDQLLNVYYALVESKLRYSIKFWGNSYKYNMKKAFTAQKRAIRAMVCVPPWESCKEYFKKLKVLTAPSVYVLILLTDVIKNRHFYESDEEMKERESTRRMDLTLPIIPKMEIVKHCPRRFPFHNVLFPIPNHKESILVYYLND